MHVRHGTLILIKNKKELKTLCNKCIRCCIQLHYRFQIIVEFVKNKVAIYIIKDLHNAFYPALSSMLICVSLNEHAYLKLENDKVSQEVLYQN